MAEAQIQHIDLLLTTLYEKKGSDLHLKIGAPPIMRSQSKLCVLSKEFPVIDYQLMEDMVSSILGDNEPHNEKLREHGSVDLSYSLKGVGRFRFNIFFQRGSLRVVVRYIPHVIPDFEELNLPQAMLDVVNKTERGLILITGATGSGKSTTLASLINHINHTKNKHIITIEDPIEFLIKDHHSLITQRELGMDCFDPHLALKSALRQDPDIILFSELRTKETISTALMAAETGHLVFSTIHSQEAAETISRILSLYPSEEQKGVRLVLASTLKAVFAQRLIPKKDNSGNMPVVEILMNSSTIQGELQKGAGKEKIREIMSNSQAHWGMQTFDQDLTKILNKGLITKKEAMKYASSPEIIQMATKGIKIGDFNQTQLKSHPAAPPNISTDSVKTNKLRLQTDSLKTFQSKVSPVVKKSSRPSPSQNKGMKAKFPEKLIKIISKKNTGS